MAPTCILDPSLSGEGEGLNELDPVSAEGASAFRERILQVDVKCIVFEANWGKWSRDLAVANGTPGR